jgi:hypothetical protein
LAAAQAVIHARTEDYTFLSWGQCICQVWHREMSADALQIFFNQVDATAKAQQRPLLFLIVAEEHALPPPAPLRAELARHLEGAQQHILRSAVVHEGSGFRAALVRSFVTGFSVLFRASYPRRVFANVEDACGWLGAEARAELDTAAFLDALKTGRLR